jgi:uncharacterized protein
MDLVPSDRDISDPQGASENRSALPRRDAAWYAAALFIAWSIAWLIGDSLRDFLHWGDTWDTAFWVAAKILIWVLPVIIVLRRKSLPVAGYVGLRMPGRGLAIGALAGLGLLAFSYAMDAVLGGASFNIPVLDAALFNGLIVAPLVEEFTMRGFYLESLERSGLLFMQANTRQALVFVAMHIPGWFFQGRLRSPLSLLQIAVFLWLLGLLLGWIKKQSGSLYAPIAVHVLNNLYSAARG